MGMLETINQFVDTMLEEKHQFENLQSEVSRREEDVLAELDEMEKHQKDIIYSLEDKIKASNDTDMQDIFLKTSDSISQAIRESKSKITEAVKGMTFIHDFEQHFTISVFGKVKAGKSYIGNLVMGQPLRKAGISSSYDKLDDLTVHVYDRGKMFEQKKLSTFEEERECNGEEFYVNKSEATSTIQWVNIGGMCWFDTPGIGSITLENEELAKEYVKNSDLVIFACNSDAAGTRQEFSEIRQLHDMEKPLLLLLTQSDMYDFDVDEDGEEISILVPKSQKDRKDQEQYMLDTLREQGMEDVLKYADVLTVSALLAVEALQSKDEEMFEQSNIGKLLEKLTDITKNEAADIKRNTPKSRINEMIDSIVSDLGEVKNQIIYVCSGIEDSKRDLLERKDWMIEQIKGSMHREVMAIVSRAKAEVEKDSSAVVSEEMLSKEIDRAMNEAVKKVCVEEALSSMEKIPDLDVNLTGIGDMKMRKDSIAYEHTSVHQVPRPASGFLEKVGETFFHKEYHTWESRTETRYSTFDIGVNDNDIATNIIRQLDAFFTSTVEQFISGLTKGYYEPVELLKEETTAEIEQTIHRLTEMRM